MRRGRIFSFLWNGKLHQLTSMLNGLSCNLKLFTLRLKLLCNCHFLNFSTFSKIDCHILFTVTCHVTLFVIEIVMRMVLLKNIIL